MPAVRRAHPPEDEVGGAGGVGGVGQLVQRGCRTGQGVDHQAVPRRQHLVIQPRHNPLRPRRAHLQFDPLHPRPQLVLTKAHLLRHFLHRSRHRQNIFPLKIPTLRHPKMFHRQCRICLIPQHLTNLLRRPHIKLSLMPFGVSVEAGIKSALRRAQVAEHPIGGFRGDTRKQGLAGGERGGKRAGEGRGGNG